MPQDPKDSTTREKKNLSVLAYKSRKIKIKKVAKLTDYQGFIWNFRTCPEYDWKFYIFSNKEIRNGMMENCFVTHTIGFVCTYRHARLNKPIGLDLIFCF